MKTIGLAPAALLVPMLAQVGFNSGGAAQEPVLRITVNLVQVDAVVTDSRGRQVTDLTADDFEVLEDGRPQKITAFSYVRIAGPQPAPAKGGTRVARPAAPPPPGGRLTPQQVRRTIVLMADDLGLSFESTARVRRALKKFVDEQMQEGDLVAIIRTRGGMGSLEQFTSDKHILYAAIDRVRWYPGGMGGAGAFTPIGYEALSNAAQMRMAGRGGASRQTGGGGQRQIEEGGNENFSIGTLAAVNYVVRELRELPGRKAVVLFSDGMPVFVRGRPQSRTLSDLRELTDLANRSAVLMYAVDARGLETIDLTAADNLDIPGHVTAAQIAAERTKRQEQWFNSQQGLDFLAQRTGGFVIHDSNDLNWGLGRVLDDLSGYYLIGYKPDESSFEAATGQRRFHRLQVKVRVRGLEVRSRTGYFGVTDEQARPVYRRRVEKLAAALTSPFNSADLKVRLTCLFSEEANSAAVVRVLLHVDAEGLTFSEEAGGMRKTVLELVALAFDEKGESHGAGDRTFTLRLSSRQYQQALRSGILFTEGLALEKPGAYQMRVAVRDPATGKVGSASQFMEIPDVRRHRLAISGINLNGVHAKIADGEQESSDVAHANTPAVRVFQTGEAINYACVIFDAQVDRTTGQSGLETQLLVFRDARQVYAGPVTPFHADGQRNPARLVLTGGLPRDTLLEPGEYVLVIAAWDKLAPPRHQTASQWIDLEVVK